MMVVLAWPVAAASLGPTLAWHTVGAQNPLLVAGISSAQLDEPPDTPSAKGQQQNHVILKEVAILWHFQSLLFPSALIHFLIDFSGFTCQLVSGRAGSKMTESHGLGALCSGFYWLDFMWLEPWLPLGKRNVETILNPRMQAGNRRTLVTHFLPVPTGPEPVAGRHPRTPRAWFILPVLLHNHSLGIGSNFLLVRAGSGQVPALTGCSQRWLGHQAQRLCARTAWG